MAGISEKARTKERNAAKKARRRNGNVACDEREKAEFVTIFLWSFRPQLVKDIIQAWDEKSGSRRQEPLNFQKTVLKRLDYWRLFLWGVLIGNFGVFHQIFASPQTLSRFPKGITKAITLHGFAGGLGVLRSHLETNFV